MWQTAEPTQYQNSGQQRLSELLMAISLATDLGTGQPMGHALRTCYLSVALAGEMGCTPDEIRTTHHVALLRYLGCTAGADETAAMTGGDEVAFNAAMAPVLMGSSREMMTRFVRTVGNGHSPFDRARLVIRALADPGGGARTLANHCEAAAMLASRLGLGADVIEALGHGYERWDGQGYPAQLRGDAIPLAVRIAIVARDADVFVSLGEDPGDWLERRAGHAYDPAVVSAFGQAGREALDAYDASDGWAAVLDLEPQPVATVSASGIESALRVFADFVDLKSPCLRGHSPAVAELADAAGRELGMDLDDCRTLRRAGLVHDIGRVGIENGVWDKAGPLTTDEWERVRLHPYLTQRILTRCGALAPLAELAASHHERLDGSGYHRGCGPEQLSMPARILATADVFSAACEERPYRPAISRSGAADLLEREANAGRLDAEAVGAVLSAAGMEAPEPRRSWPAGLTDREVEVLRLIARGRTNRQVAEKLSISPKTVGRHIENIYRKIDVSTRPGATLFAMEQRLLD